MMFPIIKNKTAILIKKIPASFSIICFLFNLIMPVSFAQSIAGLNLPIPGEMVSISPAFQPAIMKGITVNPDNPLLFDFLIDIGQSRLDDEAFKTESTKLIKYFLASLTVPEEELWVNLSPYEDDRIIPDMLGETEMGRDLLGQDYVLKQLTASLLYPENDLGSSFWNRVYEKTYAQFGTTDIPINTFNKIWIVPEKAVVYEHNNTAFIVESRLKVMLEEDYVALNKSLGIEQFGLDSMPETDAKDVSSLATQVIKEIVIPEIEKEVNEGQNFANLRQIYQSMILSSWYKIALRESLLGQVYADQNKTKGIDLEDKQVKFKIYDQYLKAFNKGVYDFIKEDYDPKPQDVVYRKYISGGVDAAQLPSVVLKQRVTSPEQMTPVQQQNVERAVLNEKNQDGTSNFQIVTAGVAEIPQKISKKNFDNLRYEVEKAVTEQRVTEPSRNKRLFENGGVSGNDERREIWGPESVDQAVLVYQRENTPMTVYDPDQDNGTSSLSPIYKNSEYLVRKQGHTTSTTPIVTVTIPSNGTKKFGVGVTDEMVINGKKRRAVVIEQFKGEKIEDNPALPLYVARAITKGSPSEVEKIVPATLRDTAEGRQEVRGIDPVKLNRVRTQITEPIDQAMRATFDLDDTGRVANNPEKTLIRNTIGDALDEFGTKMALDTRSPSGKRVRNLAAAPGGSQEQDFGKAGDGVDRATIAVMEMPKGVLTGGFAAQTLGILGRDVDHVVYVPQSPEIGAMVKRDLQSSNLTQFVTVSESTSVDKTVEAILTANSPRPGGHLGRPVGVTVVKIRPVKNNEITQSVNPPESNGSHIVVDTRYMQTAGDALLLDEGNIPSSQVFDRYSPFSTDKSMERLESEISSTQRPTTGPSFISKQTVAEIKSNPNILAEVINLPKAVGEVIEFQKMNPNETDFGQIATQVGQIKTYVGKRVDNGTLATKANDFYNTFSRRLEPGVSSDTVKKAFELATGVSRPTPTAQAANVPQNISFQAGTENLDIPRQEVANVYRDIPNLSKTTLVALGTSAVRGGGLPKSAALEVYERAPGLITDGRVSRNTAAVLLHAIDKGQLSEQQPIRFANTTQRNNIPTPMSFEVARFNIPKAGKPVGGINLNPKLLDLQIKRDGDGIPLPLNEQPLNDMKIDGFLPFIIQITPVTDLQLLLGINPEVDKETELSKAG